MKSTKLTCDCGCGATITDPHQCGWLVLSQLPRNERGNDPKLDRELQFSSLKCLENWAQKANLVVPGLQKTARNLFPRGTIHDENVPGVHV